MKKYEAYIVSIIMNTEEPEYIKARSLITIIYSSVTNTSKRIAFQTQNYLEENGFIASVINIGDIDQ